MGRKRFCEHADVVMVFKGAARQCGVFQWEELHLRAGYQGDPENQLFWGTVVRNWTRFSGWHPETFLEFVEPLLSSLGLMMEPSTERGRRSRN